MSDQMCYYIHMKIISKEKDYYDYLVSHFGYDEPRVLDRRNKKQTRYSRHYAAIDVHFELFSIAGMYYPVVYFKGK